MSIEERQILAMSLMWLRTLHRWLQCVAVATTMQLRQLRPLIRSTSTETVKTLVKAFILCRLDYSNSLFYGMTEV